MKRNLSNKNEESSAEYICMCFYEWAISKYYPLILCLELYFKYFPREI